MCTYKPDFTFLSFSLIVSKTFPTCPPVTGIPEVIPNPSCVTTHLCQIQIALQFSFSHWYDIAAGGVLMLPDQTHWNSYFIFLDSSMLNLSCYLSTLVAELHCMSTLTPANLSLHLAALELSSENQSNYILPRPPPPIYKCMCYSFWLLLLLSLIIPDLTVLANFDVQE